MGAWGGVIMGFFGTVFAALTMAWQWHVPGLGLLVPFAVFLLICLAAAIVIRHPGEGLKPSPATERALVWSSAAEGIAIPVALILLANLHRSEWALPAVALIVGLHFVPIGMAARFAPYLGLALILMMAGAMGFAFAPPLGGEIAGVASGFALWAAASMAVRRDLKAKQRSSV